MLILESIRTVKILMNMYFNISNFLRETLFIPTCTTSFVADGNWASSMGSCSKISQTLAPGKLKVWVDLRRSMLREMVCQQW